MRVKHTALFLSLVLVGFQSWASSGSELVAVVDAGSTGSRIHVYEVISSEGDTPSITEVYNKKGGAALASFADHPEQAGTALQGLLNDAEASLVSKGYGNQTLPLYVYSTAGMRLLPTEKAQAINTVVQHYVEDNYPRFKQGGVSVKTIAGSEEAFFAWTSANSATHALGADPRQTSGIVELGGASLQVAYAVNYIGPDVVSFHLNGHDYHVVAKSFLGIGQTVAMSGVNNRVSCGVTGSPVGTELGQYNYTSCHNSAVQYLAPFNVHADLGVLPKDMTFYGLAAFYYSFGFFSAPYNQEGLTAFQHNAANICTNNNWEQMQTTYPKEKPAYLQEYCFAGAYQHALLTQELGFADTDNSPKLEINSGKINGQVVEWSHGVVVAKYLPPYVNSKFVMQ